MTSTPANDPAPRGVFVVFEGGDGAGKSTQVALLSQWLGERGVEHVLTREPGGTALGTRLRELLLHVEDGGPVPRAEALLFAADRAQHAATLVRPALAAGRWVVSDRYIDSSIAYQGGGRDLDTDEVARLSAWATDELVPDLTVLLDVPVAVGAQRRRSAAAPEDRMESESVRFHEQVAQRFRQLAEAAPQRYLVLDATAEPAALSAAVRDRIDALRGALPDGLPDGHTERSGVRP
ncbi:dTMP kinase [Kineosphaera limosa]|uniref:Thymidylate kinase n=1 Tax=Kineosphaera limosa NBRC 100340 TaxID=1184609 RepID=K6WDT8_9MICO|nr:dTMP kinase [Kineosphaera limosa]NYE01657.1 dTMP kinase [Kineosphaera limosa]GAB97450.1 thymidylate kinase [Kineosphaera limosa NBRC 100340]